MIRSVCESRRLQEQHLSDISRCYKKLKQKRRKRPRTFRVLVNFHGKICKAGTHSLPMTPLRLKNNTNTERRQGMSKRLTALSCDFIFLHISNTGSYLTPKLMVLYGTRETTLSQAEVITVHSAGLWKQQTKTQFPFVFSSLPSFHSYSVRSQIFFSMTSRMSLHVNSMA